MKSVLAIFLFTTLMISQTVNATPKLKIPIPYGTEEKIIKVLDLPDDEMFKTSDGKYFDIGAKYTKSHIVWLSYKNTKPEIVGYVEDGDEYVPLTEEELKEIEEVAGVDIPDDVKATFFDRIGSKIVFGIIGLLIIWGIIPKKSKKDPEA